MLRFHKFSIGWHWTAEYGSSENPAQFTTLFQYSPLHNVRKEKYPATLILTGDHDDRVLPIHSYKFTAALQDNQVGKSPILLKVFENTGHGRGKPLNKILYEESLFWSFLFCNTVGEYHFTP